MTTLPIPPVEADLLKCRCADLWAHPAVRLLTGETLRPGGLDLTESLLDRLDLAPGTTVIDIGSGTGATLAMLATRGLQPLGIDYSASLATDAVEHAPVSVGDAERLPLASGSVGAVLMECVLSAFPDKDAALSEAHRVLAPGGYLGLTDVTLAGAFPEPLDSMIAWIACAAGALPPDRYHGLLSDHGFEVDETLDQTPAMAALVAQARRRFALLQGAIATGIMAPLDDLVGDELAALVGPEFADAGDGPADFAEAGQLLLTQIAAAVDSGDLGYTLITARRV